MFKVIYLLSKLTLYCMPQDAIAVFNFNFNGFINENEKEFYFFTFLVVCQLLNNIVCSMLNTRFDVHTVHCTLFY